MTISASNRAADSDRLGRALDLYRDLTVALSDRIADLKTGRGGDDCKRVGSAIADHRKLLQSVLEHEASLGKSGQLGDGAGGALDLDAARAEILARLAAWAVAG